MTWSEYQYYRNARSPGALQMTHDEFSSDDLRYLYHQMRLRQQRERNKLRSTALVACGLIVAAVAAVWMAWG